MRLFPPNMGGYLKRNWQYLVFAIAVCSVFFLLLRVKHLHDLRMRPAETAIEMVEWYMEQGKLGLAREKVEEFIRDNPTGALAGRAYFLLSQCLFRLSASSAEPRRLLGEAIAAVRRAMRLGYDRASVYDQWRAIGRAFMDQGDHKGALDEFSSIRTELPDISKDILLDKSDCLMSPAFGESRRALELVDDFLANPCSAVQRDRGYLSRAKILIALERVSEARQILATLYDRSEDREIKSEAAYRMGLLHFKEKEYPYAVAWFNESLQSAPGSRVGQLSAFWIAESHRLLPHLENAWEGFVGLSRRSDILPDVRFATYARMGDLRLDKEAHGQALDYYLKAVEGADYGSILLNSMVGLDEFSAHVDSLIPHMADLDSLKGIARVYECMAGIPDRPGDLMLKVAETYRALADQVRRVLLPRGLAGADEDALYGLELEAARRYMEFVKNPPPGMAKEALLSLYAAGTSFYNGGDYFLASKMIGEFLEQSPDSPLKGEARLTLGRALMRLREYRDAVDVFLLNIRENPKSLTSHESRFLVALCYLEMGSQEHAEKEFNRFINLEYVTPANPLWRNALFFLGRISLDMNRTEVAARSFEEALQRELNQPKPREEFVRASAYFLAICHVSEDDWEGALSFADMAVSPSVSDSNPLSSEMIYYMDGEVISRNASFLRGDCYYALGRAADAIEAHEEARRKYPTGVDHFFATAKVGVCYQRLDLPKEAESYFLEGGAELRELLDKDFEQFPPEFRKEFWRSVLDVIAGRGRGR